MNDQRPVIRGATLDDFLIDKLPLLITKNVVEPLPHQRIGRSFHIPTGSQMSMGQKYADFLSARRNVEIPDQNMGKRSTTGDVAELGNLSQARGATQPSPGIEVRDEKGEFAVLQLNHRLQKRSSLAR